MNISSLFTQENFERLETSFKEGSANNLIWGAGLGLLGFMAGIDPRLSAGAGMLLATALEVGKWLYADNQALGAAPDHTPTPNGGG